MGESSRSGPEPIYQESLTLPEIDNILSFLVKDEIKFFSPFPEVNEAVRLNHYLILERDLLKVKLGKSEEIHKVFSEELEKQFYRSMETPLTAVGINAATIVGEAMTQLTLKLKGQVGTSSAKQSENLMDQANKLLGPSNSFKDRASTIFFTPSPNFALPQKVPPVLYPITFQGVFSQIQRIADTIVGDLVETKDVGNAVETDWLQLFTAIHPDRNKYPVPQRGEVVLRLGLHLNELMIRDIAPADIGLAIMRDLDLNKLSVKAVWAPLGNAELWIWNGSDDEDILEAYVLRPVLELSLGGVKGIINAVPSVLSYLTWIDRERHMGSRTIEGIVWDMYELTLSHTADTYPWTLNNFITVLQRIPGDIRLLENYENLSSYEIKYWDRLPKEVRNDRRYGIHVLRVEVKRQKLTPEQSEALEKVKAKTLAEGKEYKPPKPHSPRTLLQNATEKQADWFDETRISFMSCNGSNLQDLLALPGVNNRYTYSNAARDVVKVLGVEASWRMFVEHFLMLFDNLLPHFAILLADFMHMPGSAASYSATGQKDQGRAAFGAAALERAAETIINGAAYNVVTRDVNVKLATGQLANIGTGAVTVLAPQEILEMVRQNREILARGGIPYLRPLDQGAKTEIAANRVFGRWGNYPGRPQVFSPPPVIPTQPPTQRPAAPGPPNEPVVRSGYMPTRFDISVDINDVRPLNHTRGGQEGTVPPNFRIRDGRLPASTGSNIETLPPQQPATPMGRPPATRPAGVSAAINARKPRVVRTEGFGRGSRGRG